MNEETTRPPSHTKRDIIERLVQLAGPEPSLDAARRERLEAAVRPVWQKTVRRRRARRATSWVALAAAVLLAAVLAGTLFLRFDPLGWQPVASVASLSGPLDVDGEVVSSGAPVRPGQRLGTGEARVALELLDGVDVRLDRRSQLQMLADRELVLEQGAVYIDTDGGWVYYIASPEDNATRYLFRSPLLGKAKMERLTPAGDAGFNRYKISPN